MLSSKDFESQLQLANFQELEDAFQNARSYFYNVGERIKEDEISSQFPAFCYNWKELRVKFPTFKLRIVNSKLSQQELYALLGNIGRYCISDECNVVSLPKFTPVQATAIYCFELTLAQNQLLADNIEKILSENKIHTERCVTSGHLPIPIKVDEEGYITVINHQAL